MFRFVIGVVFGFLIGIGIIVTRISFVVDSVAVNTNILSVSSPAWMVGCPAVHGCSADSLPFSC